MFAGPQTEELYALKTQRLGWTRCLEELVDNALDADAHHITIEWRPKKKIFSIKDNGKGVQEIDSLYSLGKHVPHSGRRQSGQFGIGFKHATAWLWGRVDIETWRDGRHYTHSMNYEDWAKSGSWHLDDPIEYEMYANDQHRGLFVICSNIQRDAPKLDSLGDLINELSFDFYPALQRGIEIEIIHTSRIYSWKVFTPPIRTDVIKTTLAINGKTAFIDVGIVPESVVNIQSGLHYFRAHRLVKRGSSLGCNGVNPSRIFGLIELDRKWGITPHKDDLDDRDVDELASKVEEAIRPILEKAGKMADILSIREIENNLSDRFNEAISGPSTKEKRNSNGGQEGTVTPKHSGRKRRKFKNTQPGNAVEDKARSGGVRIVLDESSEDGAIGRVEHTPLTIHVWRNHEAIIKQLKNNDYELCYSIAMALYSNAYALADPNGVFPSMRHLVSDNHPEKLFAIALGRLLVELKNQRTKVA